MNCLVNLVHSRYVQRARGCNAERPQRSLPATVKVRPLTPRGPPHQDACTEHSEKLQQCLCETRPLHLAADTVRLSWIRASCGLTLPDEHPG